VVVGAGSSALELAGLLHENGASTRILVRSDVLWAGEPHCPPRSLVERTRVPESGLGGGWRLWFYSNLPGVFRHLPEQVRVSKARNVLGPSGANWLHDRVEGKLPVLAGHSVAWAKPVDGRVRLGVARRAQDDITEIEADHVIAATGYRVDLDRLTFLSEPIRARLATVGNSPAVGRSFQSSIDGLYFIGPAVSPSFGPVTRFVYGARHAATTIAPRLARGAAR
jgi:hypothetical protein